MSDIDDMWDDDEDRDQFAVTVVDQRERAVEFATAMEEIESLRQQLAAAKATIKAKDDYLRLLIGYTSESTVASLIVQKALAATQDLSGLVLCEAEPVFYHYLTNGAWSHFTESIPPEDAYDEGSLMPLYKAK